MKQESRSNERARLPLSAMLLTVLASAGLAAFVANRSSPSVDAESSDPAFHEELIIRLERVEQRLAELNIDPAHSDREGEDSRGGVFEPAGDEPEPYGVDEPNTRDVYERLARLETIEQERQESQRRREEERERVMAQRRAQRAQIAAAAAGVMLDPANDDMAKIRAWQNMRMNAAEYWSDAVVAEAVRIGTTAEDPQVRADIWRQAHANHTHPLLLQPLLQALTTDPDRSVREEAAETLDLYLDQPGVPETLQTASQYDADPGVRMQAATSLGGPQGGF